MRAARAGLALAALGSAPLACSWEEHIRLLEPSSEDSSADGGRTPADDLRSASCNRWSAKAEPPRSLLMLVIDVSGSMLTRVTADRNRWDIEGPILANAIAALPPRVGVGAVFYPNMPTRPSQTPRPVSACVNLDTIAPVNELGPADSRQRAWLEQLLDVTTPNDQGGSPTHDAYLVGLSILGEGTLGGTRQILLLTDGHPTFSEACVGTGLVTDPVDERPVVSAISAARRAGIRTFVVGSPGSELTNPAGADARPYLSRAAEAGGTATAGCSHTGPRYCHFDMVREPDFGSGLEEALREISGSVVGCGVPLPEPPASEAVDPDAVNVVVAAPGAEDLVIPRVASSCASGAGWHYDADGRHVVLCPLTCELAHADARTEIELVFGCPAVGG